jgi:hypothetical protein
MMAYKSMTMRLTKEREEIIEKLRKRLAKSDRPMERIHGVVTTTGIIDEALKELEKALDQDGKTK